MRAIEAEAFSGFGGLRQVELPKPQPAKGRVLVRVAAAGVTPLEYTILSGGHPRAKVPLVLGNEGSGGDRGRRRLRSRRGKPRDVHGTLRGS
jgi:NADPH2:quinone reductase